MDIRCFDCGCKIKEHVKLQCPDEEDNFEFWGKIKTELLLYGVLVGIISVTILITLIDEIF
jgi:hypothetical protein